MAKKVAIGGEIFASMGRGMPYGQTLSIMVFTSVESYAIDSRASTKSSRSFDSKSLLTSLCQSSEVTAARAIRRIRRRT